MRIIISPTKKMNIDTDNFPVESSPVYMDRARVLRDMINSLSYHEAKKLWKCNDSLVRLNRKRFKEMDFETGLTPAIISYEGLQFQHMSPLTFSDKALDYVKSRLRILSGLYGVLKPFDGILPYRLEMQAKLPVKESSDLYEFWSSLIYEDIIDPVDRTIINLASKEYSKCVTKYITDKDRFITCTFGEVVEGKVKQKGTASKIARGEMVRYMAENFITDIEKIKDFNILNYRYSESLSTADEWVFILEKED